MQRMRALLAASITSLSRGIHSELFDDGRTIVVTDSGNDVGFRSNNTENGENTMRNKLIAATAMAVIAYAAIPAHAAKVSAGCSGDNLSKTESMVENMADGPGKIVAQKEIAQAQDALLGGKMGVCAAHLNKAMHAGEAK
ncbi:hypothetical protein [Bradyrhizobium sp. Leo121]|uniref:hypothetical protein n=1 Tax=Bradyrhizobium sp. Leo121 TaxID=1571195 RepID=UPI001FDEC0FF|nr:hypothetical protein [Bradyrhizobium sp. Leo121]